MVFVPWDSQPLDDWALRHAPGSFIDLDGISTHYVLKGAGEPVILLHGFFFDTHMWSRNIEALSRKYRVYALDFWGFGFSSRRPLDYGYELYAAQLLAFMDRLGIERASLIGQSMGGGTIIKFTVNHRERVNKTILVNAAGLPNKLPLIGKISNLPGLGEWMYGLRTDAIRKFTLKNTFLYNGSSMTTEFYDQLTRSHKIEGSSRVMLAVTRKQFFDTLSAEISSLGGMDVPTLIVWGREERTIPLAIGQKLHGLLHNSRLAILDQAGHCSNIDQYDEFNRLTVGFLSASAT